MLRKAVLGLLFLAGFTLVGGCLAQTAGLRVTPTTRVSSSCLWISAKGGKMCRLSLRKKA